MTIKWEVILYPRHGSTLFLYSAENALHTVDSLDALLGLIKDYAERIDTPLDNIRACVRLL